MQKHEKELKTNIKRQFHNTNFIVKVMYLHVTHALVTS